MRSGFQQKGLPRLVLGSSSVQAGRALADSSRLCHGFGPPDRSILVAVASDPRAAAMPSKIVFTALPSAA